MNTLVAKMQAWQGFFDASKVKVRTLDLYSEAGNQPVYPMMYSGGADWSFAYSPADIVKKWLDTPDAHMTLTDTQNEYVMEFNDYRAPLDKVAVRQALAYLIPRQKMISAAYDSVDPDGVPEARPDGLTPSIQVQLRRRLVDDHRARPAPTEGLSPVGTSRELWHCPKESSWQVAS